MTAAGKYTLSAAASERQLKRARARVRALGALARRYPADFAELQNSELRAEGLQPITEVRQWVTNCDDGSPE